MGNKEKKNRRMWSGIKPGDENFTPIPANIGLSEERLKWEELSFWQRAERSDYFKREGREHWLRACVMLKSVDDFKIAYEIGPPDIYTDESLLKSEFCKRRVTLASLTKMHPHISFPEPLKNLPHEPLGPLFGLVMLKDLCFEQLLTYVQPGAYFYPDTPTDEISEMVQRFKRENKEMMSPNWKGSTASDREKQRDEGMNMMPPHPLSTDGYFGGILRQNSAPTRPKKNVRWASLKTSSDNSEIQMKSNNNRMMEEDVRLAMEAPFDDDHGWEGF